VALGGAERPAGSGDRDPDRLRLRRGGRGAARCPRRLGAAVTLGTVLLVAAGCGVASGGSNGKPTVVATTTQLGDWARAVGGDAVSVHQILRPNTDPHEYEPRPADVVRTAGAAVVFESGEGLDDWMDKVVSEGGGHPKVVVLARSVVDGHATTRTGGTTRSTPKPP
jgi:ABC-type Zn uptake system ZnuABC Zn-binding protein ZnuA